MGQQADRLQVRKRLYTSFPFYAEHAVRIRTKKGEITSLLLNPVQCRFNDAIEKQQRETGRIRVIILKGRQQGFSTFVSGWMYSRLSQRKAKKGIVVTHKADSTRALFDMYQRIHTECPEALKCSTKYSSRKELVFDKLDTGIMVATAGGDGIARGETLQFVHLSEIGFWPKATAADNFNGLMKSVPDADDTAVFIESTANGYNLFKTLWDEAVAGTNGFIPFFAAWFETQEYRLPIPAGVTFERTLEEDDLVAKYALDDEQLNWRRREVAQNGRELFMQEYPCCPEEAFIASGRPVFNNEQVATLLAEAPEPITQMDVEEIAQNKLRIVDAPRYGRINVYREKEEHETYTIGADVGIGIRGGDWSVAHILDSEKRQVAVFRGQVDPHYYATILHAIGTYYNNALIGPEQNNHGLLTCVRLWKDLEYANVYMDVQEGNIDDNETARLGFKTNVGTRPLIIDRLRAAMRENDIQVYDADTLREMRTFIVNDSGKMEAETGCHDDCVMSLAIANHIHPGRYQPYENSDDYYVEAL